MPRRHLQTRAEHGVVIAHLLEYSWPMAEAVSMSTADERTVLITGATDGIGKLVAKQLAAAGYEVMLHGRNAQKGRNTIQDIRHDADNARVQFHRADFAALEDVRQLAREITKAHEHINLLINNAGIGFGSPGAARETSRDGYELRFAVNYLAPFLLTHLLLTTIRRTAPARIVNVASIGQAPIDFDDVMLTRHYDGRRAYAQSKLALVMFTLDLAAALQGTGVAANAIHPATLMNTKMVSEARIRPHSTVEEGADAIFYLATSPDLDGVSGRFFDGRRESRPLDAAYDPVARRKLRELTLDLTDVSVE
jgi:NAD(P)-dependent dehydrogenase (short-subunit alcohol dehydrogenase family)